MAIAGSIRSSEKKDSDSVGNPEKQNVKVSNSRRSSFTSINADAKAMDDLMGELDAKNEEEQSEEEEVPYYSPEEAAAMAAKENKRVSRSIKAEKLIKQEELIEVAC